MPRNPETGEWEPPARKPTPVYLTTKQKQEKARIKSAARKKALKQRIAKELLVLQKELAEIITDTSAGDAVVNRAKKAMEASENVKTESALKTIRNRIDNIWDKASEPGTVQKNSRLTGDELRENELNRILKGVDEETKRVGRMFADLEPSKKTKIVNDLLEYIRPAIKASRKFTPDEQIRLDRIKTLLKIDESLNKVKGNIKTSIMAPIGSTNPEMDKALGRNALINKSIRNLSDRIYNSKDFPDPLERAKSKEAFQRKHLQSLDHLFVKSQGLGLWSHLWEDPDNIAIFNHLKNQQKNTTTGLTDYIDQIENYRAGHGVSVDQQTLDSMVELLDEYKKSGMKPPKEMAEAMEEFFDLPESYKGDYKGLLKDSPILQGGGTYANMTPAQRAIALALMSHDDLTAFDNLTGADGRRDAASRTVNSQLRESLLNPKGSMPASEFPGSMNATTQEVIDMSRRPDGSIDLDSVVRNIHKVGSENLKAEIERSDELKMLLKQAGHSNPRMLAALAITSGLGLAMVPFVSEANREAFTDSVLQGGSKFLNEYDRTTVGAWDEAVRSISPEGWVSAVDNAEQGAVDYLNDPNAWWNPQVGGDRGTMGLGTGVQTAVNFAGDWVKEVPGALVAAVSPTSPDNLGTNLWNFITKEREKVDNPRPGYRLPENVEPLHQEGDPYLKYGGLLQRQW